MRVSKKPGPQDQVFNVKINFLKVVTDEILLPIIICNHAFSAICNNRIRQFN
jgi:hypothetical protein